MNYFRYFCTTPRSQKLSIARSSHTRDITTHT